MCSLVISIDNEELQTPVMHYQTPKFMSMVEEKIGNNRQPIFNHIPPEDIYYDGFDDNLDSDKNVLL